jgi:hypothetical protein
MKKIILPLLAVVLAAALSAFTVKADPANKVQDGLFWFTVANQAPASYDGNGQLTESQEINVTGCDNMVASECRYGYSPEQLNFDGSGNPVSVKSGEFPSDVITRHSN